MDNLTPIVLAMDCEEHNTSAQTNPSEEDAHPIALDLRTVLESTRRVLVIDAPVEQEDESSGDSTSLLGDAAGDNQVTTDHPSDANLTAAESVNVHHGHANVPAELPTPVPVIASLSYTRDHGLSASQTIEFNLWLQSAQAEWDESEKGEDDYDPSSDPDQVQTWWLLQAQLRSDIYEEDNDLPFVDPGRSALYEADTSEETFRDSLPTITISATLPQSDLTGDAKVDEASKHDHARLVEALMNPCQICGMPLSEAYATMCDHVACVECMVRWLSGSSSCPVCRAVLVSSDARIVALEDASVDDPICAEVSGGQGDGNGGWAEQKLVESGRGEKD